MAKNFLHVRMLRTYENLSDFAERSGIPVSTETLRAAIYHSKKISIPSLMLILKHLDYSPAEIKKRLIEAGDRSFSSLIGDIRDEPLTKMEKELIAAIRAVGEKEPAAIGFLIDGIELSARAAGVNIKKQMAGLRRRVMGE